MAYTATYTAADLGNVVIDVIGAFLAGIQTNAALLVTLIVLAVIVELTTGLFSKLLGGMFGLRKK